MKKRIRTPLFFIALLSLCSFATFPMESKKPALPNNAQILNKQNQEALRELQHYLKRLKNAFEELSKIDHEYVNDQDKVINIAIQTDSGLEYAIPDILSKRLKNFLKDQKVALPLLKQFLEEKTNHILYVLPNKPDIKAAWDHIALKKKEGIAALENYLKLLSASENKEIKKLAIITRCMMITNFIIENSLDSYLEKLKDTANNPLFDPIINETKALSTLIFEQENDILEYEYKFDYLPAPYFYIKKIDTIISDIDKTLSTPTSSTAAKNNTLTTIAPAKTQTSSNVPASILSPQQQRPLPQETSSVSKTNTLPNTILTYAPRVNDWFKPDIFEKETRRDIIYHRFPKIIDTYLHHWGETKPYLKNPNDIIYDMYGEIIYDDGNHDYVQYHTTISKDNIIYHRGLEERSQYHITKRFKKVPSSTAIPILYHEKKLGKDRKQIPDGIMYQDNDIVVIRDNALKANFIVYLPLSAFNE